jgi:hypothetical protein
MKDLFVYDQDNLTLGDFGASGLVLHSLQLGEFAYSPDGVSKNPWVINFNSGFGYLGKPQHILFLKNGALGSGELGNSGPVNPGPPKTTEAVVIDGIYTFSINRVAELRSTVAHELAHRTNVWHHGDTDYDITRLRKESSSGQWTDLFNGPWIVSGQKGQSSGDVNCIMRYELIDLFEWGAGPYQWQKPTGATQRGDRYRKPAPPGTTFCASYKGTGVNASTNQPDTLAGDATRGCCQSQICVNDVKGCTYSGQGRPLPCP